MMKYFIHRESNRVYALTNGTVVDEYDCEEFDYNESDLKHNATQYSEISKQTYVDYINDFHTNRNLSELKINMQKMKYAVCEISEIWEQLPFGQSNELSEEYPFEHSFDEMMNKIIDWVQHHDNGMLKKY